MVRNWENYCFLVFPGNACILHTTTNVFSYVNSDIIYRFALGFVIFTPLYLYSTSTIFVLLQVGGTTTNVVHLELTTSSIASHDVKPIHKGV